MNNKKFRTITKLNILCVFKPEIRLVVCCFSRRGLLCIIVYFFTVKRHLKAAENGQKALDVLAGMGIPAV